MTTNTTESVIVCRSLPQLDALVAERLFGWRWVKSRRTEKLWFVEPGWVPPKEWDISDATPVDGANIAYGYGPDLCPHFTTWAMLGEVVAKVEAAGYAWDMGSCQGGHKAAVWPMGAVMFDDSPQYESDHQSSAPVALCLAALAAFGCQVQLELN